MSGIRAAALSRESGVHCVYICRLKNGKYKDTSSLNADRLREAMMRLDPEAAERAINDEDMPMEVAR